MTERVIGPTGSPRRRWMMLAALLAVSALGLFYIAGAQAVHDLELFELDRNALDDASMDGEDWDTLYANGANNGGTPDDFTGVVSDNAAPGDQFQGGGSKDNNDLDEWLWKEGEPLDKDDITNTYVAGYAAPETVGDTLEGDLIIYYGLDRLANNGTAQVGFWFFQDDSVGKGTTATGGGFTFTGEHQVHDILVQSNFTSGGRVSNVDVFEWVGSGGSHGSLDLLHAGTDCVDTDPDEPGDQPLLGDDPACATANIADEEAPWPYTPKSGSAGTFPLSSFFEGGVNISRLLREAGVTDVPCFPVFMAETRSSAPFDSRLKDLALGNFQLCEAALVTTPQSGGSAITEVTAGATVSDHAVVTGTGVGAPVPTGTVKFFLCNPSQLTDTPPQESPNVTSDDVCATNGAEVDGATCDPAPPDPGGCGEPLVADAGTPAVDATADSAGFVVSTVGRWCWRGEYSATAGSVYDTNPSGVDETDASVGECFTVVTIPTMTTTAQSWIPNDSATVSTTGPMGYNLTGSVRFRLYSNSSCSGTALYDQIVNIPAMSGLGPVTVSTTNGNGVDGGDEAPTDVVITAATGTYSWLVEYTPAAGDTAHTPSSSVCHDEHSDLTIVNNDPNIPAP